MGELWVVIWGALMMAPLVGGACAYLIRQWSPAAGGKWLAAVAAPAIILVVLAWAEISFRGVRADVFAFGVGYTGYCCATFLMVRAKHLPRIVRVWPVLTVPMVIGYLFGTIGIVGLVFVVGDAVPERETSLTPHLTARLTTYGIVTSAHGGVRVSIYKSAFGLERRVARVDLEDANLKDVDVGLGTDGGRNEVKVSVNGAVVYTYSLQ